MIFISKLIVPKGFHGITLFPFIFLKKKSLKQDQILINHEKIHLKQQKELLILLFYLIYGLEWIVKFFIYKNGYLAYRNLSFEREAYQNENNQEYLKKRKLWSFLNYL
jgi:UDP-galactopyranose mutase